MYILIEREREKKIRGGAIPSPMVTCKTLKTLNSFELYPLIKLYKSMIKSHAKDWHVILNPRVCGSRLKAHVQTILI